MAHDSRDGPVWELLRAKRLEAKHTLTSLADAVGIDVSYLAQVEKCRRGVRRPTIVVLANELGMDPDELATSRPPVVPYPPTAGAA